MPDLRSPSLIARERTQLDQRVNDGLRRIVMSYIAAQGGEEEYTDQQIEKMKDEVREQMLAAG